MSTRWNAESSTFDERHPYDLAADDEFSLAPPVPVRLRVDWGAVALAAALLVILAVAMVARPWLVRPVASCVAFVGVIGLAAAGRAALTRLQRRRPDHPLVELLRKAGL